MTLEYEYSFYNYNKEEILEKVRLLGFINKGTYVFRVQTFYHPTKYNNNYIRVRDEGHRITMTHKLFSNTSFANETEVEIDNFDNGVKILEMVGCVKKYYYEKIREIWHHAENNIEVIFDTSPASIERMEIEAKTQEKLDNILFHLGLNKNDNDHYGKTKTLFGLQIPKNMNLTFDSTKYLLLPYVTKNREQFIELVDKQHERYNELIRQTIM